MLLPEVARAFQDMGFHALTYDPRSIGDSDGLPRNQIDPLKQAEDLSGEYSNSKEITTCSPESRHLNAHYEPSQRGR